MKTLLRQLQIGNSVAEYDDQLERYFLQTQLFDDFLAGNYNVVRGDKGTGKTAMFRIIQKQHAFLDRLRDVIQVPVFNQAGTPVFQKFNEIKKPSEGDLAEIWKTYIFAVVGNKIVDDKTLPEGSEKEELRKYLEQHGLRERSDDFTGLLSKAFGALQIQLKFSVWPVRLDVKKAPKAIGGAVRGLGEPGLRLVKQYLATLLASSCGCYSTGWMKRSLDNHKSSFPLCVRCSGFILICSNSHQGFSLSCL